MLKSSRSIALDLKRWQSLFSFIQACKSKLSVSCPHLSKIPWQCFPVWCLWKQCWDICEEVSRTLSELQHWHKSKWLWPQVVDTSEIHHTATVNCCHWRFHVHMSKHLIDPSLTRSNMMTTHTHVETEYTNTIHHIQMRKYSIFLVIYTWLQF